MGKNCCAKWKREWAGGLAKPPIVQIASKTSLSSAIALKGILESSNSDSAPRKKGVPASVKQKMSRAIEAKDI